MIEARGLTKTFRCGCGLLEIFKKRQAVTALNGVDLCVKKGQIMALLGPNGAGKTTLIKILASLIIPDSGDAKINGHSILTDGKKAKRHIGLMLGEERSFYWRLTGRQNLKFFAALYGMKRHFASKKIEEIADILEIENLDQRYQEYSTGTKQRIAVARCLLSDAKIIIMDEPTRSLDPVAAANFRKLIREKLVGEFGKTVLFSTHQIHEAEEMGEEIAIIDKGRIKAKGTLSELRGSFKNSNASLTEIFQWSVF